MVPVFNDQFSVPGYEGYETNAAITGTVGNGGSSAPIVPVVTLPHGARIDSVAVKTDLARIASRIERAVPHTRSAPVRVTGTDALSASSGSKGGVGLLAEGLLGGLGALVVLAFVFASLLAVVPLVIALISIMTSFLLVWGLTAVTPVSPIVGFLIALVGLGVAIDYSLLIVVRWREERARGHEGEEAIVRAMATAGRAVVFSGSTVGIGLLGLVVVPVSFISSVGYAGLVIPLVSVAVATTLLPVILAKFGQWLDWPQVRSDDKASRAWTGWAKLVVRYRWAAASVAVAVLAALVFAVTSIQLGAANGNPHSLSAAACGVLTLVWQHGYGSNAIWGIPAAGSIPSWLPVIVFAFLFGLSMDYEVFILSRMREEYDATGSTETAVVRGIGRTGRLVTSAALILFLGFVAMSSAPSTQVKTIATGLGAGIILDATIIRALLVPAAVSLLGRWNWWLPHPLARILRVAPPRPPLSDPGRA